VSYTAAACLGLVAAVLLDLFALRTRLVAGRVFWVSYAIILGFQLAYNGILTGRGVVRYDPGAIIGVRVLRAPVEDLAFGFALVLVTLSLWTWWGRRGATASGGSPPSPGR
jgi:lycopene cyclase domain-containing protein